MKDKNNIQTVMEEKVVEMSSMITGVAKETLLGLNFDQLKRLGRRNIAKAIRNAIYSLSGATLEAIQGLPDYLRWWQDFYAGKGIGINLTTFTIPPKPAGDWWLVVVAPDLNYQRLIWMLRQELRIRIQYREHYHILGDVINHEREQRKALYRPYALWIKAVVNAVEADLELANKSANDLDRLGQEVITLKERILLEVLYSCLINPGEHLDVCESWTLCAGSRYCGDDTFIVYFDSGTKEVMIKPKSTSSVDAWLRARTVVF
ncbi:MAG: hypothetical protein PHT51_00205 [Patescibacteria group bacterium]|nr:hypothetical protein [Patescibacteria group bacterium]MDD4610656.1 hypothetical protein [Patescibacteria group bacterium]